MAKTTKKELLTKLKLLPKFEDGGDFEIVHYQADKLLLEYIDDKEISDAFEDVGKWYA